MKAHITSYDEVVERMKNTMFNVTICYSKDDSIETFKNVKFSHSDVSVRLNYKDSSKFIPYTSIKWYEVTEVKSSLISPAT